MSKDEIMKKVYNKASEELKRTILCEDAKARKELPKRITGIMSDYEECNKILGEKLRSEIKGIYKGDK
jgi:hypothetical protein